MRPHNGCGDLFSNGSRLLRRKSMQSVVRSVVPRILLGLFTLVLFCGLPVFLAAQATSGVTGVVTDESGALLVGARVTLSNSATGFSATTTTNSDGAYMFLHMLPATYTLSFSKDTFRTVTISNVELGVSVVETENAKLPVGDRTERVE